MAEKARALMLSLIRSLASLGLIPTWEMAEDGVRQAALRNGGQHLGGASLSHQGDFKPLGPLPTCIQALR